MDNYFSTLLWSPWRKIKQDPYFERTKLELTFHMHTNDSNFAIGVVLGMKDENLEYVIYYINKNIQEEKLNYIVIEKEMLVVVYARNKFRH